MIRTVFIATSLLLAALVTVSPMANAQGLSASSKFKPPSSSKQYGAKRARQQTKSRLYTPRIEGRSDSFIVEGIITAASDTALSIKTSDGARHYFDLDEQTTLLDAGELISIASISSLTLSLSDLRAFDRVEIIAERAQGRKLARIITRIHTQKQHVAKR